MASQRVYFTKYANDKFEILNKYKVFITKERVEEVLRLPDLTAKKGKYLIYKKEVAAVIIKKEGEISKVITFYPTK